MAAQAYRLCVMKLVEARHACHRAIQLNTHLARAFVPAQPDDSHTALTWLPELDALAGQPLPAKRGGLRLALRLGNLVFTLLDHSGRELDNFALEGRRFEDACNWLAGHFRAIRIDPMPLWAPLHFELDDHPFAHRAPFSTRGHEAEFQELSNDYGDAASILSAIASADPRASPVRCWPHHFDIATLLTLGGSGDAAHTLGVGMSPGDGSYTEPYYYVNPWPYPDASQLPALTSGGAWHTHGWVGAVLPIEGHSPSAVRTCLDEAMAVLGA